MEKEYFLNTKIEGRVCIKEPIIMRLNNKCDNSYLFERLDIDKVYSLGDMIIIEEPDTDLIKYVKEWHGLITCPLTGICHYPHVLNIDKNIAYEYLSFNGKMYEHYRIDSKFYHCIPYSVTEKEIKLRII